MKSKSQTETDESERIREEMECLEKRRALQRENKET